MANSKVAIPSITVTACSKACITPLPALAVRIKILLRRPFFQTQKRSLLLTQSQGHSGIPEVSSGIPSPPRSPPLAANRVAEDAHSCANEKHLSGRRQGAAAHAITEECERLFCQTLSAIFLGERNLIDQDLLVMDATFDTAKMNDEIAKPKHCIESSSSVESWVEIWDYVGDVRFKGFVGGIVFTKSLFIFITDDMVGKEMKPGLMALMELASTPSIKCSQLVVCLDRHLDPSELQGFIRDLGWVGFELTTLAPWAKGSDATSTRWALLSVEV